LMLSKEIPFFGSGPEIFLLFHFFRHQGTPICHAPLHLNFVIMLVSNYSLPPCFLIWLSFHFSVDVYLRVHTYISSSENFDVALLALWFFGTMSFGQTTFGRTTFGQTTFGWTTFGWTTFGRTTFGQTTFGQTKFGRTTSGWNVHFPERIFPQTTFPLVPTARRRR
jgi:hypothetical protein